MHTQLRMGSIERIYIHTNEGPETEGGAESLHRYLDSIDGGYHVIVDDHETIRAAEDDEVVWAEGGDNEHALSVCIIGRASQTASEWGDPYSQAAIERAAQQVAVWAKFYGIPVVHVRPGAPGEAPVDKGIAEHADDHAPASQGHTDPGPAFPIQGFIHRVIEINQPQDHIDWAKLKQIADWVQRLTENPLHVNERGTDVVTLNQWLVLNGANPVLHGIAYGANTENWVTVLKAKYKLANRDGSRCGGDCAKALIKHAHVK